MRLQSYINLGFNPVLAVVNDGARRVLQVTGWIGGTGTAPATGLYVGATDYVSLIANAVDIRGASGSAIVLSVVTKTTNYTITSADDIILGNAAGGVVTITLPTAVGVVKQFSVKRINSGGSNVIVNTTSAQTIDGSSSATLTTVNTSLSFVSDNSNWMLV